jgi:4-oxalomesaconate tautomerase
VLKGSPAHAVAHLPEGMVKTISVEHPTGEFSVRLVLEGQADHPHVVSAGLLRTARKLFDGRVFPRWDVAAHIQDEMKG